MKKLLTLLLAVLMLAMPLTGLAEAGIIGGADGETAIFTTTDNLTLSDLGLMTGVTFNYSQAIKDALDAGRRVEIDIALSDWPSGVTGEEQVDQIINDVLDCLKFQVNQQGDEWTFALNMTGNDVLTLGGAVLGDDIYFNSNLLGGTIVFTMDEVVPVINRLLDMFVVAEMITAEEAEEIKAQLPMIIDMVKAELESAMSNPLENVDLSTLDLTALVDAIAPLANNVAVSEVTMQPRNCDPATTVATLTVSPEEFKAIVKAFLLFLKNNPAITDAIMAQSGMNNAVFTTAMEEEEVDFNAVLDEAMADLENETLLAGDMVGSVYLGEDGMPVCVTLTMPTVSTEYEYSSDDNGSYDVTESSTTVNVALTYARLTTNNAVNHSVTMEADNIALTGNLVNEPNRLYLSMAGSEDGEEMMFVSLDQSFTQTETNVDGVTTICFKAEDVDLRLEGPSNYVLDGVNFSGTDKMDLYVNDVKFLTMTMNVACTDPGASIINSSVVRPAELDDSEFANWFVGVFNGIQSWPFTLIQSLPESVLELMMS